MSAYTTKEIDRNEAIRFLKEIEARKPSDVDYMTDKELEEQLDTYAYSGDWADVLGVLYNFKITNKH